MSSIVTSIHGKKLGLDHDGALLAPKGLVCGERGKQIHAASPSKAVLFDDFTNNGLDTNVWLATEGTDSATSVGAVVSGGIGGVLRLTTGDAGTGLAADTEQITHKQLQWQASNGGLAFEARLKISAITTMWMYIGFTDTVAAALEAPFTISTVTYTSNATDAVGFLFDTGATAATIRCVGVKNDVDGTHVNTGLAPVADKYATYRIEIDASGNANFFRNGIVVGYVANAVTAGADLTPTISVSKLSVAASMDLDLDYIHVSMNRGLDGTAV